MWWNHGNGTHPNPLLTISAIFCALRNRQAVAAVVPSSLKPKWPDMDTIEIIAVDAVLAALLAASHLRRMRKRARDLRDEKMNRLRWG